MIYINLLPVREIKQRKKAQNQIIAFIAAVGLLLTAMLIFGLLQAATIDEKKSSLDSLKKEKQKYSKIISRIKQIEKDKEVLKKRINVIKKLKHSSSLTVHALDEVSNLTPSKRMWLTSLTQSGSNLRISGMALDNRTIAKYMDDLKASPYINRVTLANSSLKGFAGRNLKSFSISCSLVMPELNQTKTN